jgi:hypothetical protein
VGRSRMLAYAVYSGSITLTSDSAKSTTASWTFSLSFLHF